MQNKITTICIVGGGTAGWMAASLLSSTLGGSNIKITLVESADIASTGVGESTVPSIMDFLRASQINLRDFIQATCATFKLGIRFDDWLQQGKNYFHPFGKVGKDVNGFDFYQVWLKAMSDGHASTWLDFSPNAVMAQHQRFMLRPQLNNSNPANWVLGNSAHALHLDAVLVARYLRELCLQRGVQRIEATVKKAELDNKGFIQHLQLQTGELINSDFFIDCSGFNGLLIEQTLKTGYEDWSQYLPCDRAVVVQSDNKQEPAPYTIATALDAGWRWQIPLQQRTGNGYVYSSRYCPDDEAISTLLNQVDGNVLNQPRVIPFVTGKRHKIWHKNCLALGLAGGFLEPLESTAIHLIYKTLVHFIQHFPDADFDSDNQQLFNQKIDADYVEIRDFIILHYCTAGRSDTPFWRDCQQMPVPDSLKQQLQLFKQRGQLQVRDGQFFSTDSWHSILEGMQIRPKKYHPLVDGFDFQSLSKTLTTNVNTIHDTVIQMPKHAEYIRQHCPAIHHHTHQTRAMAK
ncbi:tryptophan halogenase family protein [Neptunicella marina]|uniref:Tryptophan 7-halogenase n=1 Tax=Neptunicella marina TaxID=2125989 RepID=A0A8J6IT95_9ALTE|nr:tryptophan halogenase family protein [Neptunicella marina]MBC3765467.1 tryptophan 7-halogenase [Neptunicella marina]